LGGSAWLGAKGNRNGGAGMNLESMNLESMNLKSMNLKSMNLESMNLKLPLFTDKCGFPKTNRVLELAQMTQRAIGLYQNNVRRYRYG
jgi:hypothetical protein